MMSCLLHVIAIMTVIEASQASKQDTSKPAIKKEWRSRRYKR